MKLIDAIKNVKKPDKFNADSHGAPLNDICESLKLSISGYELYNTPVETSLFSFPIIQWHCTDSHVGLSAIYLNEKPVGSSYQSGRKSSKDIQWISEEIAQEVRDFILKNMPIEREQFDIMNPNEELGEDFSVEFVTQSLTDNGYFDGRPVKALVWYDGLNGRTTPEEYRKPGKSYTVAVDFKSKRSNCVLVQDGEEQKIIHIYEFKIPLNVDNNALENNATVKL